MMTKYDSPRLLSLDVFRGFVIASMILVTDPGTYKYKYHQLGHALWTHPTCTDMIAPAFLFMVGVAIPFSFTSSTKRGVSRAALFWRICRRSVLLTLLGLALNELPVFRWHTLHYNGILQLVGRCYFISAMLYLALLYAEPRRRAAIIAVVAFGSLALYAALLKFVPVPGYGVGDFGMIGNLPAYVDRALLGVNHMGAYYRVPGYGVAFDPNGLLITVSASFSTLIGVLAGVISSSEKSARWKLVGFVGAGTFLLFLGLALNPWTPMIKNIWTATYALFSTGVSLLAFYVVYWIIDLRRFRRGLTPLLILGTNAILAFSLSTVVTRLLGIHFLQNDSITSPHQWMFDHVFLPWLPPYVASLTYALLIVVFNILLVYPFYRKRIFLRL
jgi:predicted acyltransferase